MEFSTVPKDMRSGPIVVQADGAVWGRMGDSLVEFGESGHASASLGGHVIDLAEVDGTLHALVFIDKSTLLRVSKSGTESVEVPDEARYAQKLVPSADHRRAWLLVQGQTGATISGVPALGTRDSFGFRAGVLDVIHDGDGRLVIVRSGTLSWHDESGGQLVAEAAFPMPAASNSAAAHASGGSVWVGGQGGTIWRYSRDGVVKGHLMLGGDVVFLAGHGNSLWAIDAERYAVWELPREFGLTTRFPYLDPQAGR